MLKKAENNYCTIKIVNARQLKLEVNTEYPSILKKDNKIISISFPTFTINIEDKLEISNQVYQINFIEEKEGGVFILNESYITASSRFLFPLIFPINKISSEYFYKIYFYNSYLYCNQFNYKNCIYVVYRFFESGYYKKLEAEFIKNKNFIECRDIDKNKVLFIFQIPAFYNYEIDLFKQGKFLKYTPEAKSRISCFYKGSDDVAVEVIRDDKDRRKRLEQELDCTIPKTIATISKPIIKEETLEI